MSSRARRRRDQSFTQRDLTRAMKAAAAAGVSARFEVDVLTKRIVVIPTEPSKPGDAAANPWDEATYAAHQKRSA